MEHWVCHIVISSDEKEPHVQLVHESEELIPFALGLLSVVGIALDQITDGDHELRSEQIEVANRLHPDPRTVAPGAICHDGEMKSGGSVQDRLVRPRLCLAFHDRQNEGLGTMRYLMRFVSVMLAICVGLMSDRGARATDGDCQDQRLDGGEFRSLHVSG